MITSNKRVPLTRLHSIGLLKRPRIVGSVLIKASITVLALFIFNSFAEVNLSGKIKPCPQSPNCVCSIDTTDNGHYIAPFLITANSSAAWSRLKEVVISLPRTKIVEQDSGYMHVEFKSFLFRFVDDVEVQLLEDKIHIRSASRVGYSDLGVNRRRMEDIRVLMQKAGMIK